MGEGSSDPTTAFKKSNTARRTWKLKPSVGLLPKTKRHNFHQKIQQITNTLTEDVDLAITLQEPSCETITE